MNIVLTFLFFAVLFLGSVAFIENESEGWLTFILLLVAAYFLWGNSPTEIVAYIGAHIYWIGLYVLGYIGCGLAWSIYKWERLVDESFANWVTKGGLPEKKSDYRPMFGAHISRIYGWVVFWWASMAATVVGEVLVKGIKNLIKTLRNVYESVTDARFGPKEG